MTSGRFARRAWADLGGDPGALGLLRPAEPSVPLRARLDVAGLLADSVGLASLAMGLSGAERSGTDPGPIAVRGDRVAVSARSDRHLRLDGAAFSPWAPMSGFWRTGDGWVRTHANYPHHEARLRTLLGLRESDGPEKLAAALAVEDAHLLEERAAEAGAILVAVREREEWARHPQALALESQALIGVRELGETVPRPWPEGPAGEPPLAGIRVLDLTRVIAGPVATRDLAFAGAEVLRIDSPLLPEPPWQHLDTGQGKRSALLDLATPGGRERLEELLAGADAVVTGYRPGALDRFGLAPDSLAVRYPGLVIGTVSAWGTAGPWSSRRGFDSIVQAASGIALAESEGDGVPGALPAQALDHSAGHFLAAGVAEAVRWQRVRGGSWAASVSLAGIAQELLATEDREPGLPSFPGGAEDLLVTADTASGRLVCAPPVLAFPGAPAGYASLGGIWGADAPEWE